MAYSSAASQRLGEEILRPQHRLKPSRSVLLPSSTAVPLGIKDRGRAWLRAAGRLAGTLGQGAGGAEEEG